MKKITAIFAAGLLGLALLPAPASADHGWSNAGAFFTGVVGGAILGTVIAHSQPAAVYVPAPRVYVPPPPVWVPGHYETRFRSVWVPGHWETVRPGPRRHGDRGWREQDLPGRNPGYGGTKGFRKVWVPGHSEKVRVQVWVPGHWEERG